MQYFKGYVPTRNKKCLRKFKGKELKTIDEVSHLEEFAGILADDIALIDIDDEKQSEILYKIVTDMNISCRVYKTSRGKHFLFKNSDIETNKIKTPLAIGIHSDIKLGSRNSYSILRFEGKDREIIRECDEPQTVPKWLTPIRASLEFLEMEEGDGRNQKLFNYILTLQSNDFTVDEARETIRIINSYVLKNPLSDSEIETILRDEAFQKPVFFNGRTFLFDKFAMFMKSNDYIIKINNQLHLYRNGIYVRGEGEIEAAMLQYIPNLSRAKRAEVLSYLETIIREDTPQSDARYVFFNNGVYDAISNEFLDFSPDIISTNKIPWDFNPDAKSELLENTIAKMACNDEEITKLLYELVGYCFYRRNELRKSFILIGDKANGKSTFLDMIKTLLGERNVTFLDMGELNDRFKPAELFGKLANIGDDIGDEFIGNPAMFKKLVTGDSVTVERKGEHPFNLTNFAKFLFSANNIPRIKDKTGAVLDRMIIVPFNATFSKNDPDYRPFIKYELRQKENIEALIVLAIEGLRRVLENQQFTQSKRVKIELAEYEETNNPIIAFYEEYGEDSIVNESTKSVYMKYNEFCLTNGLQPISNIEFSKQIKKRYGFNIVSKKINGKKYRVFVKG